MITQLTLNEEDFKIELVNSTSFHLVSQKDGSVYCSIEKGSLFASMWNCPGEGRKFLKVLELLAEILNIDLLIPTVTSDALEHILVTSSYARFEVYDNELLDTIEYYAKEDSYSIIN